MKGISNSKSDTILNELDVPVPEESSIQFTNGLKVTDDNDDNKTVVEVDTVFTEYVSRDNISSGDPLKTILGKISKFFSSLKSVAFSGSYNDLSNKPTIPTVGNGILTIQRNGSTVKSFNANSATDVTANITVPTALTDLSSDTNHQLVSQSEKNTWNGKSNFSGSYNDLTNKPTIPTNNNQLTNGAGYITSAGSCAYATSAGSATDSTKVAKAGDTMTGNLKVDGEVKAVSLNTRYIYFKDGSTSYLNTIESKTMSAHRFVHFPDKNGTVAMTSDISSERFKENIVPLSDDEAMKLLDVETVIFDYKDGIVGEEERYGNRGVIAEQVEPLIPYVIEHEKDENDEDILRVDYRKFIPYLIKMTQTQQDIINDQQKRIKALEKEIKK